MGKLIDPRTIANADVKAAVQHYNLEASWDVAERFVDALESAYQFISENPAAGSPRWAHELGLPGLRSWPLKRFPWLVLYVEEAERIDVWRVVHAMRDIPGSLRPSEVEAAN